MRKHDIPNEIDENIAIVPVGKANAIRIQAAKEMVDTLCESRTFHDNPVKMIKAVRAATGLGLKESKLIVDQSRENTRPVIG